PRDEIVTIDGAVATDELGAELAVAAVGDGALHVALERHVDGALGHALVEELSRREAQHDLRPAEHGYGRLGREARAFEEARHHARLAAPALVAPVDGDLDLDVEAPAPARELVVVENVGGRAGAIGDDDPAVAVALAKR